MPEYKNPSQASWNETVDRLKATFEAWGIGYEDYQISASVTGADRNRVQWGAQNWAEVSYRPRGAPNVVTMRLGSQSTPAKNLSAIAITIEGIRMQERRGLGAITASHYLALAAPVLERDPYEVLGVRSDAPMEVIEASYKAQAKMNHPDVGGDAEAFKVVAAAWERIKADRGVTA